MGGGGGGELTVEGMDVGTLDGDLGEEREGDWVFGGAELGDLLIGAGLLEGEVVGGEAEDDEAFVFELLVEIFDRGVLRSETAFGSDVDDQKDFSRVVGEGGGFAGEGRERNVVQSWHEKSL